MGNVVVMSNALDAIKPAVLELLSDQHSNGNRRLKRAFRLQSAAFMAALMTGNWPLFQQPITSLPARYCRSASHMYSVGDVIKTATGTYRECFQDGPDTQPYWGDESRPHARSAPSM
jgi:hypothetical protein